MPRLHMPVVKALAIGLPVALLAAAIAPRADRAPHARMVRTIPVAYHPQVQNQNKAKAAPVKPTGPQPSLAEELGPKPARNEAPKLFQTPLWLGPRPHPQARRQGPRGGQTSEQDLPRR